MVLYFSLRVAFLTLVGLTESNDGQYYLYVIMLRVWHTTSFIANSSPPLDFHSLPVFCQR
jgi:hypothetical protein